MIRRGFRRFWRPVVSTTHPEPEVIPEGLRYRWWPPGRYLLRVARQSPELASQALLRVPATRNPRVVTDLAETASLVELDVAAEWVQLWTPRVAKLGSIDDILAKHLGVLAMRLLSAGRPEGLTMATLLLEPIKGEGPDSILSRPQTRVEYYWYGRLVENLEPHIEKLGIQGLHWAVERLVDLLEVATPWGRRDDGHSYWFRSGGHRRDDQRLHCAQLVERVAGSLWDDGAVRAEVVVTLTTLGWPIGIRLVSDLLCEREPWLPGIRALVSRPELWRSVALEAPQERILHRASEVLPPDEKQALIDRVQAGPSPWVLWRWQDRMEHEHCTRLTENWKLQRLIALGEREHQPEPHSSVPAPRDWSQVSNTSLLQMISEGNEKSLKRLEELIEADPPAYLSLLPSLQQQADPSAWGRVLLLYYDALRNNKLPNLPSQVLQLAVSAAESGEWNATRWAIGLIGEALRSHSEREQVTLEQQDDVWSVISAVGSFQEPDDGTESDDPRSRAINSPRPRAIEAAVQFALWRQRLQGTEDEAIQQVYDFLDRQLDPSRSWDAVHSMFGDWLPWLVKINRSWVERNTLLLFPTGERQHLADALWHSYLRHPLYTSVYKSLRKQYCSAVELYCSSWDESDTSIPAGLARHIVAIYWHGAELLHNDPVELLFQVANPKLRQFTIEFVGRVLEDSENVSNEILDRIVKLWENRLETCSGTDGFQELEGFGLWVDVPHLNEEWRLSQLVEVLRLAGRVQEPNRVLRHLADACNRFPSVSFRAFQLLLEADQDDWFLRHDSDWHQILEAALQEPEISEEAKKLINTLGKRGHWALKTLLASTKNDETREAQS